MKTAELIGPALDWAVAKCEGENYRPITTYNGIGHEFPPTDYSTDWSQGGPIIEREWLDLTPWPNESDEDLRWQAVQFDAPETIEAFGPTPLIAAMRCFVTSRLGDEVEVPDRLFTWRQ